MFGKHNVTLDELLLNYESNRDSRCHVKSMYLKCKSENVNVYHFSRIIVLFLSSWAMAEIMNK